MRSRDWTSPKASPRIRARWSWSRRCSAALNISSISIEALEVRFLANRDNHLHFSLLTDFRDAHEETLPEDAPLLRLARKRIEELNDKYKETTGDAFFLFHRPRRWNPGERVWMGYERKRGKLADLNQLSNGAECGRSLLTHRR